MPRRWRWRAPASIPRASPPTCRPERLCRFFVSGEHGYQVNKELRDVVVFAPQSLISDPPFSKLDLISCRNLFIYLEPALQERLIPLLHFALLDGGYLFLGSAEGIGPQEDLFEPVSKKWRIYRRIGPTRHDRLQFPLATPPRLDRRARARPPSLPTPARLAALAQHLLLERYAPACVIIDRARRDSLFPRPDRRLPRAAERAADTGPDRAGAQRACAASCAAPSRKPIRDEPAGRRRRRPDAPRRRISRA